MRVVKAIYSPLYPLTSNWGDDESLASTRSPVAFIMVALLLWYHLGFLLHILPLRFSTVRIVDSRNFENTKRLADRSFTKYKQLLVRFRVDLSVHARIL